MAEVKYSKELVKIIKDYLKSSDYIYAFDKNTGMFQLSVGLNGRLKRATTFIFVEQNSISFSTISPIGVDSNDKEMMTRMAMFFCRVNYELKNGSFQMDVNDGEIRYRVFLNCDNMMLSQKTVLLNYIVGPLMFYRYGDAILSIIYAGATAEEAYNSAENGRDLLAQRLGIGNNDDEYTIEPSIEI